MKHIFLYLLLFLFACGNENSVTEKNRLEIDIDTVNTQPIKETAQNFDTIRSNNYSSVESSVFKNQIIELCRPKRVELLINGFNNLAENRTDSTSIEVTNNLNRSIVDNFKELEYKVSLIKHIDEETTFPYRYIIRLISFKDNIVEYNISEQSNIQINDEWSEVETKLNLSENRDSVLHKEFNKVYFEQYSLNLDSLQLWNSNIIYGHNCGITGSEPEYRTKLNEILNNKDKDRLIKWLKSNTVELQMYAIEGILTLKKQGVQFSTSTYQLIDIIEQKDGNAFTCSGCTHWQQSIKEIVKRIKKEHNTI